MIPEILVELVKASEGFSPIPYLCPAGFWTIGYGELCQQGTPRQSKEYASERLRSILLPSYVAHALRLSPGLANEDERKLAAIADFVYNLGPTRYASSTLRRKINERAWEAASAQLRLWVMGGGRKLPGLVKRREAEIVLLLAN